jgi:hypothetical protein
MSNQLVHGQIQEPSIDLSVFLKTSLFKHKELKMKILIKAWLLGVVTSFIFLLNIPTVHAQISLIHDFFPSQNFSKPAAGLNNAKIQSRSVSISVAFPLIFSEGRTVFNKKIYYKRRDFSYKGFPGGNPSINDIHDLNYTLTLQHGLSAKWGLLAFVTPGLASDFESSLSSNDFNFQAVTVFIRKFRPQFSFGFGTVYSTQFGQPFPLPVLAINWNNGKNLRWDTILPVSSTFRYTPTPKLDLGLALGLDGNNYHMVALFYDPAIFQYDNTIRQSGRT